MTGKAVRQRACGLVSAPCPVCDGREVRVGFDLDFLAGFPPGMKLVSCRTCGSGRIDPHPDEARMAAHYDEAYFRDGYLPFVDRRRADFRRRLAELEDFPPVASARAAGRAPRLLDIGAGIGLFTVEAAAAGYRAEGVEPSAAARAEAERRFGLMLRRDWPATWTRFDLVTFWDVLGHVERPADLLREARRRLEPGGGVVVKMPNFRSTWHRVRTGMSRLRRANLLHAPTVIWRFDPPGARRLLARCGLPVDSVTTVDEPDLLPLTPRWRAARLLTGAVDRLTRNRQEMILRARAR